MNGLERVEQNLEVHTKFYRKPVKLLQNRCDVINGWDPGDDAGGRVLNQLEFMDVLVGKTKEKGIAIVQTRCDHGVD